MIMVGPRTREPGDLDGRMEYPCGQGEWLAGTRNRRKNERVNCSDRLGRPAARYGTVRSNTTEGIPVLKSRSRTTALVLNQDLIRGGTRDSRARQL